MCTGSQRYVISCFLNMTERTLSRTSENRTKKLERSTLGQQSGSFKLFHLPCGSQPQREALCCSPLASICLRQLRTSNLYPACHMIMQRHLCCEQTASSADNPLWHQLAVRFTAGSAAVKTSQPQTRLLLLTNMRGMLSRCRVRKGQLPPYHAHTLRKAVTN